MAAAAGVELEEEAGVGVDVEDAAGEGVALSAQGHVGPHVAGVGPPVGGQPVVADRAAIGQAS